MAEADPKQVKAIRDIIQDVQSPRNRASKDFDRLVSEAAHRLNGHRLSPFSSNAFHEAFDIAANVHLRVASNPESANDLVSYFKQALIGLVNFRD